MKTPADALMDSVKWELCDPPKDNPENLPYPTHSGVLKIGDLEFDCYVLNTGQRIFSGPQIEAFIAGLK